MKKLTFAICLAGVAATGAHAATRLQVPVTYMADASVVASVKSECKIEDMLSSRIGPMLAKLNQTGNGTLEVGVDAAGDTVLQVQISHVLGVGGGAWSGPKAITVLAELLEGGKVVQQTKINRWTTGGVFGGFKGTCSILERSANAITKDLNEWVLNPSVKPKEHAAPKDAPKEAGTEVPRDTPVASADAANPGEPVPATDPKLQN